MVVNVCICNINLYFVFLLRERRPKEERWGEGEKRGEGEMTERGE